jgi:WD40 repeat protein
MGDPQPRDREAIGAGGSEPEATAADLGTNRPPDTPGRTLAGEIDPGQVTADEPLAHETSATATGVGDPTLGPQVDAAPTQRPTPAIPGYVIEGELGRGAMGVVYRARQVRLNRPCALKVILAGAHADPVASVRFLGEAEAVAKLQHPNIVQIHNIGEADGLPFLELEYVPGGSLDRTLDGTPWPARRAATLIDALARGVTEAHRLGVIHRDLKPSNILIAADGTPKVADFGLAKSLNVESGLTATESILGTPSYMAPEQAEGNARRVGPLADVYALGAILYELLVGRPPFRGTTVLETLEQVKTAEPVPPSRLVPGVPRDAETIALKCLQKDPGKRYESATALAEDLRRFQAGEPIVARPVGPLERGWRWCRKNPVVAGSLGAAAAALVAVAWLALLHADRQARFASEQSKARSQISGLAINLERRVAALNYERGQVACEKGEIGPGMLWLIESWRSAVRAEDAAWQHATRANLAAWQGQHPRLLGVFSHDNPVVCVAYSRDGKTLLTASVDGMVRLWDAATGNPIGAPTRHDDRGNDVAFRPVGKTVLTESDGKKAELWDRLNDVAFSPDGKTVLTSSNGNTAQLWVAATGQPIGPPLAHHGEVRAVAFSPDGTTLLTASEDGTARLWHATTGQPLGEPMRHDGRVNDVAFSGDGKTLLTGSYDKTARLWDATTGQPRGAPLTHKSIVNAVAFSPDGTTLLTASEDGMVGLWDAATGRSIGAPIRHQGEVGRVAFSPDGTTILTGSLDGTAQLWPTAELPDDLEGVTTWVEALTGLTLDDSGSIQVLDTPTWLERREKVERQGGPPVKDAGR